MPNTIKIKNSGTANATPSSLATGELALNYNDGRLFYKNTSNQIVAFTAAPGVRAWVNFDATTSPITIRASLNVASITDHGVGEYTINFVSGTFPETNAPALYLALLTSSVARTQINGAYVTTQGFIRIITRNSNDTVVDSPYVMAAFVR